MFSTIKYSLKSSKNCFPYSFSLFEIDVKSNKYVLFSASLYKVNEVILVSRWNSSAKILKLTSLDFFVSPINFKINLEVDMSVTKYGSSLNWMSLILSPNLI